jgi:phosphosulfolactate phosphohydrolase-like enzyme
MSAFTHIVVESNGFGKETLSSKRQWWPHTSSVSEVLRGTTVISPSLRFKRGETVITGRFFTISGIRKPVE